MPLAGEASGLTGSATNAKTGVKKSAERLLKATGHERYRHVMVLVDDDTVHLCIPFPGDVPEFTGDPDEWGEGSG
jgi:hypothetical protein